MNSFLRFQHILTARGIERHKRVVFDDSGRITALEDEEGDEFDGWLALPGMPNAHSHAFQRALTGRGEAARGEDSFWSWRDAMYRLANAVTPDDLYAIARRAYADMLRGGFTSVAEFHYLHHQPDGRRGAEMARAVVEAARATGIRLVLLPVYYRHGGFGLPPASGQHRFVHRGVDAFIELLNAVSDVPLGIAPHSLRAVEPGEIALLEKAAVELLGPNFPRHIHIAEQRREVEACREALGMSPIEALMDSVGVDEQWQLIHATHASELELALVAGAGAGVVLCPLTEAYLGDGIFPATDMATLGGSMAIGSDSNVRLDAIEELRLLEYGQRLANERRACLATEDGLGRPLWERLSAGGGRALQQRVGVLEPGAWADIVSLDPSHFALAGLGPERALDALITAGDAGCLESVWVGGRVRATAGAFADEAEVGAEYLSALKRLELAGPEGEAHG